MSDDPAVFDELELQASDIRVGIVAARYNGELTDALLKRVSEVLQRHGVLEDDIEVHRVPGSNELPYLAGLLAGGARFDVIVALGVVIAGDTNHHDMIAISTANAFQQVGVETGVPVINGILTVSNQEQAQSRVTGAQDRGSEFARAAVYMALKRMEITGKRALDQLS